MHQTPPRTGAAQTAAMLQAAPGPGPILQSLACLSHLHACLETAGVGSMIQYAWMQLGPEPMHRQARCSPG